MEFIKSIKYNKEKILKIIENLMLIILVLVILIFVNKRQLWLDELDWGIGIVEGRNLKDIYLTVLKTGENLPLFYIILYIAKLLFGYNQELLILCTSIIPAIIGLIGIIKISREFFDKNFEILSVFFTFTSYAFIAHVSWQLRPYGLLFCFSVWSLYFYFKRLRNETYSNIIKYGICMIFLLYSHWFGVLIALCYAVIDFILFIIKKVKARCIFSYIIAGLSFLPSFILLLIYHNGDIGNYGVEIPTFSEIFWVISFIGGYTPYIFFGLVFAILTIIIICFYNKNFDMIYIKVVASSALMIFLGTIIYSIWINPAGSIVRNRYYIVILPHTILIMSYFVYIIKNAYDFSKNKEFLRVVLKLFFTISIVFRIGITYSLVYYCPNSEGDGLYQTRVEYLSNNEKDIYLDTTLIICTFGSEWVQGLELPSNVICVNPLKYPNTKDKSIVNLSDFDYVIKNSKLVENEKFVDYDLEKYDTIYYLETYRVISESFSKRIEKTFKVEENAFDTKEKDMYNIERLERKNY